MCASRVCVEISTRTSAVTRPFTRINILSREPREIGTSLHCVSRVSPHNHGRNLLFFLPGLPSTVQLQDGHSKSGREETDAHWSQVCDVRTPVSPLRLAPYSAAQRSCPAHSAPLSCHPVGADSAACVRGVVVGRGDLGSGGCSISGRGCGWAGRSWQPDAGRRS